MANYRYLIVGGGMAADAAVKGIREIDKDGTIGIVSADSDPPYARPPLTKGLWKGDPLESVWRHTEDQGVKLHLRRTILGIDRARKTATDGKAEFGYEKLLLATGGSPRRFPFAVNELIYYRNLSDYQRLREATVSGNQFLVVGSGFIGSEIAAALAMNGKKVTMVYPDAAIGGRAWPPDLAKFVTDYYAKKGVELLPAERVTGAGRVGNRITVYTGSGTRFEVDAAVAGLGIEPGTALARAAGLSADDGILVDSSLRTNDPDIFAAGDVAAFENSALGKRMRVEHEDNALTQGRMAGLSMAGENVRYDHLPFFYSDLFNLGYEAVGEIDARHEMAADWTEPYRKGVVYYLANGRVRGVLLWGIFGKVDEARALIADAGPFTAEKLKGRIKA